MVDGLHYTDMYFMDGEKEMREYSTIYLEYAIAEHQLNDIESKYDRVLQEKQDLWEMTQGTTIDLSTDRVDGGESPNKFDQYVILLQEKRIDERLAECYHIIEDRKMYLLIKEEKLRKSKGLWDKIYTMQHLDRKSVENISRYLHYDRSWVYKIIQQMQENIKQATKSDKIHDNIIES